MIIEKQIKEAEGKELSRLLGEVLQPERKNHVGLFGTFNSKGFRCKFCNEDILYDATVDNPPCNFPDPTPLDDWNVAMKWRDWAVAEFGIGNFDHAMEEALKADNKPLWLVCSEAQPKHYLIAAALCKLNADNIKD